MTFEVEFRAELEMFGLVSTDVFCPDPDSGYCCCCISAAELLELTAGVLG